MSMNGRIPALLALVVSLITRIRPGVPGAEGVGDGLVGGAAYPSIQCA